MARSLIVAAAIASLMVACASRPVPEYVPETAGVVTSLTLVGPDLHFELAGGGEFVSPANMDYLGGQPQVGELLVTGTRPDLWVYRVIPEGQPKPNGPTCYQLYGETRATATDVFKTIHDAARGDLVLVFPKTLTWKDFGANGEKLWGVLTCINEGGQAFEQRVANAEN
jgi:hypothetical protein